MMGHNIHLKESYKKLPQNYPFYPFLSGALIVSKVDEYISNRGYSAIVSSFNNGQTLFCHFRVDPLWKRLCRPGKQIGGHRSSFVLYEQSSR